MDGDAIRPELDDNSLLAFEELCALIGAPEPAFDDWRRQGVAP